MSHVPHELHEEFPDKADALHSLKLSNAHFAKLADEYHAVNREIHRVETDVERAREEARGESRLPPPGRLIAGGRDATSCRARH